MVLRLLPLVTVLAAFHDIPNEHWETLSDTQWLEAIKGCNERKLLRQQNRLRADKDRCEKGGTLLRITVRNGTLCCDGAQRGYDPATFSIANGDI